MAKERKGNEDLREEIIILVIDNYGHILCLIKENHE